MLKVLSATGQPVPIEQPPFDLLAFYRLSLNCPSIPNPIIIINDSPDDKAHTHIIQLCVRQIRTKTKASDEFLDILINPDQNDWITIRTMRRLANLVIFRYEFHTPVDVLLDWRCKKLPWKLSFDAHAKMDSKSPDGILELDRSLMEALVYVFEPLGNEPYQTYAFPIVIPHFDFLAQLVEKWTQLGWRQKP